MLSTMPVLTFPLAAAQRSLSRGALAHAARAGAGAGAVVGAGVVGRPGSRGGISAGMNRPGTGSRGGTGYGKI
jgi:hypothetical protein